MIASPIAGTPCVITLQRTIIASPILAATAGISDAIPEIMIVSAATIAAALPVVTVASIPNPAAIAEIPAPAANKPAPIPRAATPNKAKEADNPRIAGTKG